MPKIDMQARVDRTVKNWRWWVAFLPAVSIGVAGIAVLLTLKAAEALDWRIDHLLLQMKRWTWPERYQ